MLCEDTKKQFETATNPEEFKIYAELAAEDFGYEEAVKWRVITIDDLDICLRVWFTEDPAKFVNIDHCMYEALQESS